MTCAYDHLCTIGDPFPIRAGGRCCEICTDYTLDLTDAHPEGLGRLMEGSIQRHGGPYVTLDVLKQVSADVLASLRRGTCIQ